STLTSAEFLTTFCQLWTQIASLSCEPLPDLLTAWDLNQDKLIQKSEFQTNYPLHLQSLRNEAIAAGDSIIGNSLYGDIHVSILQDYVNNLLSLTLKKSEFATSLAKGCDLNFDQFE